MSSANINNKDVKHPQATGKSKSQFADYISALRSVHEGKSKSVETAMRTNTPHSAKKKAGTKKAMHVKVGKSLKLHTTMLKTLMAASRPLFARRQMLLAEKAEFDTKYVSVDVKGGASNPVDDRLKLCDMEIASLKAMALTMFGRNAIKADLVVNIIIPSTVTTGVVNGVITLNGASWNDFSSFAAIFEEYRIRGGLAQFLPTLAASSATGVVNNGSQFGATSYNTASSTPATSAGQIADDIEHLIWMPNQVYGNVAASAGSRNDMVRFKFKTTPGVIDDATVTGAGDWLITTNTTVPYGYLRFYMITASLTVIPNAINGLLTGHFEFRMRV